MKICFISDTHNLHDQLELPEADVLVHAGDLSLDGSALECRKALGWLNALPCEHIVTIAGNHDFAFEHPEFRPYIEQYPRIIYLENSGAEVAGLKIYGSPVQPWFHDWALNVLRGAPIKKYWDLIPEDLDILVTHGPPFGVLDQARPGRSDCLGCEELASRVASVTPKVHAFGHIHGSYGKEWKNGTEFVNASVVNEAYKVVNKPIVIER